MDGRARKRLVTGEVRQDDKRACGSTGIRLGVSLADETEGVPLPAASSSCDHRLGHDSVESSSSSSVRRPENERADGNEEASCSGGGDDDERDDESDHDTDPGNGGVGYRVVEGYRCSLSDEKIKSVLSSLGKDAKTGAQLAALTELCEILSFGSEDSLGNLAVDSFASALVRLAGHGNNPEIMLLAIRALAYLCDVLPWSSTAIVSHGAVPVLCERLLSIEYLDVAEQGVQTLEKISHHRPVPCLRAGAIMAVLTYIDFFTTSIQRVALSMVAKVCKKFPSDCSSLVLEAVPTLCNLLHYLDVKIKETAAVCLNRISENVRSSPDLLDDMCKHGLISDCASLITSASGGRPSVSHDMFIELIRLLSKLASGSLVAFKALLELNIGSILRGILETAEFSYNATHGFRGNGHANQVYEVLRLLMQLLPSRPTEDIQLVLAKEKILVQEEHKFLHQLGKDFLPILVQVVNSGASPAICYGCISLIHTIVYLCSTDMLFDLFSDIKFSSFLAGLLSRKDIHVSDSALRTAQILLERERNYFVCPFVKEGVVYAIDSLQIAENGIPFASQSGHASLCDYGRVTLKGTSTCFCHVFDPYFSSLQTRTCKLKKDMVLTLAKEMKSSYFNTITIDSQVGMTDVLQKLKALCRSLSDNVEKSLRIRDSRTEESLEHILGQILEELDAGELSTFEFIESGFLASLAYYLSNGLYLQEQNTVTDSDGNFPVILKRFQTFARICLSRSGKKHDKILLTLLVQKLQNALTSFDQFPVVLSLGYMNRSVYADLPVGCTTKRPCLKVCFIPEDESTSEYSKKALVIESSSSLDAISNFLWSKITAKHKEETVKEGKKDSILEEDYSERLPCDKHGKDIDESQILASSLLEVTINQESHLSPVADASMKDADLTTFRKKTKSTPHLNGYASPRLHFYLEGKQLDHSLTLFEALLQQRLNAEPDMVIEPTFWNTVYNVTYKVKTFESKCRPSPRSWSDFPRCGTLLSWSNLPFFSCILNAALPCTLEKAKPVYDVLFMLKVLEGLSHAGCRLLSFERINAFAESRILDFDSLNVMSEIPFPEFSSTKLTEKLEQQMRDPLSSFTGNMPPWCSQLMASCPFLFSFVARWKYVRLVASSSSNVQQMAPSWSNRSNTNNVMDNQQSHAGNVALKRFQVDRARILESAAKIMSSHDHKEVSLDVEFSEEVGIGSGPTLEFYTLVSHEFQKIGLGMWRGDGSLASKQRGTSGYVVAPLGLFPCPWSANNTISLCGIKFTDVERQFVLLGKIVAKALHDGRVLDLPFSKAFYKLMLQQELDVYDIQSFDPGLGRILIEFEALVCRKKKLESTSGNVSEVESSLYYNSTRIEDLFLDFSLPGCSDYLLTCGNKSEMVNIHNLEEYVLLIVDATIGSGISRQIDAFKSGFNGVFPLNALQIFTEDELESILCGEQNYWTLDELVDHIKFDHGYTAVSPPVISLLETMLEFNHDQRRAFLQFVTGTPRLPPGGFAALSPKLTIVRKLCGDCTNMELPSVMTCANYLKLPAYSSKEILRERLLYAITEGQGSFHLS